MKLFATRVWGMGFERVPIATFGMKGHVDRLLRLAGRGDRVLFVGTQTERTDEVNRGRLLGMAEIGFEPLRTLDLVGRADLDARDFDPAGNFKFPHAVALTRAWRFDPAPKVVETLARQLTMVATSGVQEIEEPSDIAAILSLPTVEIVLPALPGLDAMRRMNDALRNSTGPKPRDAGYVVDQPVEDTAWTYGMRFGNRNVWKIGWSTDVDDRCRDINLHIPIELGLEQWKVMLRQRMASRDAAYAMEQRILELLAGKRKGYERVHCLQSELDSAWQQAFIDVVRGRTIIAQRHK
ncbi:MULTISPECIES: hypothetical protein [unclassified Rhizobium]|uniref:hypothetical protein n=1 Tax=unclassified Rhizobium TaxID=2613769 RepID=UPI001ADB8E4F|nr:MULTISPECIES: hypothetical protein [unclassified Rhizobium]MBO9127698.1 hypothetical protein [Rhizobium sp. 16-488-2b]MBO9178160.1 hypothetical protein [Rhizobium sp. 16-488-2a]